MVRIFYLHDWLVYVPTSIVDFFMVKCTVGKYTKKILTMGANYGPIHKGGGLLGFLSGQTSPSVAGIDGSDVYVHGEVAGPFAILTSQGRCGCGFGGGWWLKGGGGLEGLALALGGCVFFSDVVCCCMFLVHFRWWLLRYSR